MKKSNKNLIALFVLLSAFNVHIFAQCPNLIEDLLNHGAMPTQGDPHTPTYQGNMDEFAATDPSPFILKVGNYPPVNAFKYNNTSCGTMYYFSFDSDGEYNPINYNLEQLQDVVVKTYRIDAGGNYTSGYQLIFNPPTGPVGSPDCVMYYDGSKNASSWSEPWSNHFSTPTIYSPSSLQAEILGVDQLSSGNSHEFIADINGGSGNYQITWFKRTSPALAWGTYVKSNTPVNYFTIDQQNYYFYDNEYKYNLVMNNSWIQLKVEIIDIETDELSIAYKTIIFPPESVTFTNSIQTSENYGSLILNDNEADPITSGSNRSLYYDTQYKVRTDELPFVPDFNSSNKTEKHHHWVVDQNVVELNYEFEVEVGMPNEFTAQFQNTENVSLKTKIDGLESSGVQIKLRDPWYYYQDLNDDWQQSDEFKIYGSPLSLDNTTTSSYGGVFLNMVPGVSAKYYSVKSDQQQTININGTNHTLYFKGWSTNGKANLQSYTAVETPVVFTQSGAEVYAEYKGTNLTGDANTYSSNGQQRIVQTNDGKIHKVYESMGRVWYETSIDGNDWTIMNNGQPLGSTNCSLPDIDVHESRVVVVCHDNTINQNGRTGFRIFNINSSGIIIDDYLLDAAIINGPTQPIIAWDDPAYLCIMYYDLTEFLTESKYHYMIGDPINQITWSEKTYLNDIATNAHSLTIVGEKWSGNYDFHIAYVENYEIKYLKLYRNPEGNDYLTTGHYTVSSNLGYSANFGPSIADYVDDRFIVSWIAEAPGDYYVAAVRPNYGSYWGTTTFTYSKYPYDIETINSNTAGGCIIAFGTANLRGQYVKTSNLNYKYPQSYTGDVKVCNGSGYSDALLSTLVTSSTPYQFMHYGQSGLQKEGDNAGSITREVNIAWGENRLFIDIGNIEVDGELIGFYDVDSLGGKALHPVDDKQDKKNIANYLVSEGFDLTDKTEIYFDFGIEQLNEKSLSFNEDKEIEVTLVLLDDKSNEVLSEIKSCKVKNKIDENARKNRIKLKAKEEEKRRVKLALVIEGIDQNEMNLVTKVSDGENLPKEAVEEITIESFNTVTDYNISQNYPNPFNPATTIKYKLPAEGLVTIKVYDVLGKEITTLVNEKKNSGRYEATFNGDGLASGMYIYKIDVKSMDTGYKDYSSVRKMLLIK